MKNEHPAKDQISAYNSLLAICCKQGNDRSKYSSTMFGTRTPIALDLSNRGK